MCHSQKGEEKVWLKPRPKTSSQDTWPLETAAAVIKYETVGQTVSGFGFFFFFGGAKRGAGNDSVQKQPKERSPPRHLNIYDPADRRPSTRRHLASEWGNQPVSPRYKTRIRDVRCSMTLLLNLII